MLSKFISYSILFSKNMTKKLPIITQAAWTSLKNSNIFLVAS